MKQRPRGVHAPANERRTPSTSVNSPRVSDVVMTTPYDAEGEALAERLMLAELTRLTRKVAARPATSAASGAGPSLTAAQVELLGRLNAALREEYGMRRAMLLKRLDVLLDSFKDSPRAKEQQADMMRTIDAKLKAMPAPQRFEPADAFGASLLSASASAARHLERLGRAGGDDGASARRLDASLLAMRANR